MNSVLVICGLRRLLGSPSSDRGINNTGESVKLNNCCLHVLSYNYCHLNYQFYMQVVFILMLI